MILSPPYTWIELSKSAFDHNIFQYRVLLGPKKHLAAVVKANAYGHGLREMGGLCQANSNITFLCTSHLSEALQLRSYGITKPILVLSVIDDDPQKALNNEIHLTVYDKATLAHLNIIGQTASRSFQVHIKIDTGMSRFGFLPDEAPLHIQQAAQLPYISITGLYTHCAEPNNNAFTRHQLDSFSNVHKKVRAMGIAIPYVHATNTAVTGTFLNDYPCLTMARVGAGIYGFWHSQTNKKSVQSRYPHFNLKPVLSWKTRIMHIRHLDAGVFVGYDRTHQTTAPTIMAILPTGYKESYDRKISSDTRFVYIHNQPAPIIGRVCMNATFVDATSLTTIAEGDEVTLIGKQPLITPLELSNLIGSSNPREVPTALESTIKRIIQE